MDLGRETLLGMYRTMQQIRQFETTARELAVAAEIPGFIHVALGEEAIAAGVGAALRPSDRVTSTHRAHAHFIAKTGRLDRLLAEMMGRKTGICGGKSGEMHLTDLEHGFLCSNGIVGGGLPIATGAALAAVLQERDDVTVCFFGDGAANQGTFHESLNLAAIWKLPIVYVCENNGYMQWSRASAMTAVADIAVRASGYGMPGVVVDGSDVLAVHRSAAEAVARARSGEGPTLLECKTFRWEGHVVGEHAFVPEYRSKAELERGRASCPIRRFETWAVESGKIPRAELDAITAAAADDVKAAVEFAKASPFPDASAAASAIYA